MRTFERLWHHFNDEYFGGAMFQPKFRRTRSKDYWACYEAAEDQGIITLNYENHYEIEAIFFHEMVHQYVEEVLGVDEENHHGEVFWKTYYEHAPYSMSISEKF